MTIERLVSEAGRPLRAPELCRLINGRGLYKRADGNPLEPMQVSATAHQARSLHVANGFISVVDSVPRSQEPPPNTADLRPAVVLVGCVSQKASTAAPARDLYTSTLFRGRRGHAENLGAPWFIVSACHGLVDPDEILEPYDVSIGTLDGSARRALGESVARDLEDRVGELSGTVIELHAGDEYATALGPPLRARGALLSRPLQGLTLGRQLQWYQSHHTPPAVGPSPKIHEAPPTGLALEITHAFNSGSLDLSERLGAPPPGWPGMPEFAAAEVLRTAGATDRSVRLFMTFVAAMDRARDADRLWSSATALWRDTPWVFEPARVVSSSLSELWDVLARARVTQRHAQDAAAWRLIAETLSVRTLVPCVLRAIEDGVGSAEELLVEVRSDSEGGRPLLPLLRGPKVGPMWVRMLCAPGAARIFDIAVVPVAVDVQVRRISENLGVAETAGMSLDEARPIIQRAWADDVRAGGAAGLEGINDTCAALDPALWFYAKWGCSHCERIGRRRPIASACDACRFHDESPADTSATG